MLFEKYVLKIYRKNLFTRNDNADGIFYFAPEDFPGLKAHPYCFKARAGHDLNGFFLVDAFLEGVQNDMLDHTFLSLVT